MVGVGALKLALPCPSVVFVGVNRILSSTIVTSRPGSGAQATSTTSTATGHFVKGPRMGCAPTVSRRSRTLDMVLSVSAHLELKSVMRTDTFVIASRDD
jgi:hypothetical protein